MAERRPLGRDAVFAGALAAALVVVVLLVGVPRTTAIAVERAFDAILATVGGGDRDGASPPVVMVDIDTEALDLVGPWPWRRRVIADLVETIASAGAAALAIDVIFSEADGRSPAALARRLAAETGRADLADLARGLADDDPRLSEAFARLPVVLGFALSSNPHPPPAAGALLIRGKAERTTLWAAAGAETPTAMLAKPAAGLGATVLPGDADGVVRRVPLFVAIAGEERPGLALEAVRVATKADHLEIDHGDGTFSVAAIRGALGHDGLLRLVPIEAMRRPKIVSAADLLTGGASAEDMKGAIVFLGGSAPELGGLRPVAGRPLAASVEIQAAAARQILAGRTPRRFGGAPTSGAVAALVAAPAIAAGAWASPILGTLLAATVAIGFLAAVIAAAAGDLLVDPVVPLAALLTGHGVAAIVSFSRQRRDARRIRRRFEQHLAPQVVDLIVRDPSLLQLAGERRIVTALFTDVADFTAMTRRAEPEALVAALDAYFEGMTRIIVAHGGLIDKFVGDAVHAFFNAPLDQPGHAEAAVRCAVELVRWSEAARREPGARALGFGLTRIGIETGEAIVGEIGLGSKLDYTAHGDAVNAAARLEATNKQLGTRICIGPGTAALCPPGLLRRTGTVELRGIGGEIATHEPVAMPALAAPGSVVSSAGNGREPPPRPP
jgi:adenylate cyclase